MHDLFFIWVHLLLLHKKTVASTTAQYVNLEPGGKGKKSVMDVNVGLFGYVFFYKHQELTDKLRKRWVTRLLLPVCEAKPTEWLCTKF